MAGKRYALLIGCGAYRDAEFPPLAKPAQDVADLAALLRKRTVGGFDEVRDDLVNQSCHQVKRAIEKFFRQRDKDDLLLFYFSGHGRREGKDFYLAVNDSEADALDSTAIDADFARKQIDRSASQRKVILLDCCHSGAFGEKGAAVNAADAMNAFEGNGYGRIILTAAKATETAQELAPNGVSIPHSLFTHFIIEGIQTGAADLDQDGDIAAEELFEYVAREMKNIAAKQTPQKFVSAQHGDLIVALNPRGKAAAPTLPDWIQSLIASEHVNLRLMGITQLDRLRSSGSPEMIGVILETFRRISQTDVNSAVRGAARGILEEISPVVGAGSPRPSAGAANRDRDAATAPLQNFTVDLGQGVTLELVAIPGGTFWMGSPDGEGSDAERPRHQVTVAPFLIGTYPVTQAQWQAVMGKNPSDFKGADRPVEMMSWNECQEFVKKLNANPSYSPLNQGGTPPSIPPDSGGTKGGVPAADGGGMGIRLPHRNADGVFLR